MTRLIHSNLFGFAQQRRCVVPAHHRKLDGMPTYVFDHEFNANSIDEVVNATEVCFATLMRFLCHQNGSIFVGLCRL